MKKTMILLFIASFFAFSCKKEDKKEDTPKPNPNPITFVNFIKLNNQWDYNYFVNDVQGTDQTWKIIEMLNNGYCKVRLSMGSYTNVHYWYANASIFSDEKFSNPPNNHFALLKNNASLNDEWQINYVDEGQECTMTRKVEAFNETITVDAGTYVCTKIKETVSDDPNIIDYYWINKDVGIVQRQLTGWYDEGNGRVYFQQKLKLKNVLLN